jgi:hypothetical protein
MQGTGNINYSLDKNDFYKILAGCVTYYIPHYFILVIISIIYIYTIKYKIKDNDSLHFFKSITYILNISQNDNYVGLSNMSYLYIIISYVITLLIILEGLIRNLLYSIYVNIIQINNHNNPYNNNNCITKIKDNPYTHTIANYTAIISLSIIFLVPFIIPFLINFLKFDNYDIKHNKWFSYVILYLLFFPFITIILLRASFYKKLEIFSDLNRFVDKKDFEFIKNISNNFNLNICGILVFILVIFIYCYYKLVYIDYKQSLTNKIITYLIISTLLLFFIPLVLVFFSMDFLFSDTNNNGVNNIYDLLVKYNYPCFIK